MCRTILLLGILSLIVFGCTKNTLDEHEVTVGEFAAFVKATGYQTTADSLKWSGVSLNPYKAISLDDSLYNIVDGSAWAIVKNANWQKPDGIHLANPDEPVTQVSLWDAQKYCAWKSKRLPTADEWESEHGEQDFKNTWDLGNVQKVLPIQQSGINEYGLYGMSGNVWEYTNTIDQYGVIIKGGSFLCAENMCRGYDSEIVRRTGVDSGNNNLGFRCCCQ